MLMGKRCYNLYHLLPPTTAIIVIRICTWNISHFLSFSDCEQGSWESGLSYECRSLLFKALHNLIERCLLSRDFIRIGKWFVQPYDGPRRPAESNYTHLTFSFAFFVHGESSVCASVDVRQHPPVRRLCKQHIQQAQASTSGLQGDKYLHLYLVIARWSYYINPTSPHFSITLFVLLLI